MHFNRQTFNPTGAFCQSLLKNQASFLDGGFFMGFNEEYYFYKKESNWIK